MIAQHKQEQELGKKELREMQLNIKNLGDDKNPEDNCAKMCETIANKSEDVVRAWLCILTAVIFFFLIHYIFKYRKLEVFIKNALNEMKTIRSDVDENKIVERESLIKGEDEIFLENYSRIKDEDASVITRTSPASSDDISDLTECNASNAIRLQDVKLCRKEIELRECREGVCVSPTEVKTFIF